MIAWGWRVLVNGWEVSFGNDENLLALDYGDGCTAPNVLKTLHFKLVHFMMCKLYL